MLWCSHELVFDESYRHHTEGSHAWIAFADTMVRPANDLYGLWAALNLRNMAETPTVSNPELFDWAANIFCKGGYKMEEVLPRPVQEWIDSYDDTRKRNLAQSIYDKWKAGGIYGLNKNAEDWKTIFELLRKRTLSFHMKSDEVLPFKPEFNCVKPRVIVSIPIEHQMVLQQYAEPVVKNLKEYLHENTFMVMGRECHYTFAAGKTTSASLTKWYYDTLDRAALGIDSYICMGDDMLGWDCDLQQWIELDYSNYDSTQHDAAMEAEFKIWTHLGMPDKVKELSLLCHRVKARHKKRNAKFPVTLVYNHGETTRITGGWNTSAGGSIVNILALMVAKRFSWADEVWGFLGLKAKISFHPTIDTATFLKGRYWLTEKGTREWMWLPSCILKNTKITRTLKRKDNELQMMRGMALGFGEVPINFPFLKNVQDHLIGWAGTFSSEVEITKEYWRPSMDSHTPLDVTAVLEFLELRYQITATDYFEMELMLLDLPGSGYMISHPGFTRLQDVDYGEGQIPV